ncbi:MAG: hypothetical protein R2716_11720 [Microthrixaceae bacterium]
MLLMGVFMAFALVAGCVAPPEQTAEEVVEDGPEGRTPAAATSSWRTPPSSSWIRRTSRAEVLAGLAAEPGIEPDETAFVALDWIDARRPSPSTERPTAGASWATTTPPTASSGCAATSRRTAAR